MLLFFILYTGDIMLIFIKGFVVGIGKIIPGVSGAMLAMYLNVYEKILDSVTNFFNDWKTNIKFIVIFGLGLILAIVLGSRLILYFFTNYKFLTVMFFVGLILGGTYNFSKKITYNYINIILILALITIFLIFSLINFNNTYILKYNFVDNIVFFIGGVIDIFASLVPGISGTSLLMSIGIYNNILVMISSIFNMTYVFDNYNIYISYTLGMFISFILNAYLINYFLSKYRNVAYSIILGLSISSILFLLVNIFKNSFTIIEFILGIILLTLGILLSCILDK